MKQEALNQFTYSWLPTLGLIIFLLIFIGILYFALHRDNQNYFKKAGSMPLNDGDKNE